MLYTLYNKSEVIEMMFYGYTAIVKNSLILRDKNYVLKDIRGNEVAMLSSSLFNELLITGAIELKPGYSNLYKGKNTLDELVGKNVKEVMK